MVKTVTALKYIEKRICILSKKDLKRLSKKLSKLQANVLRIIIEKKLIFIIIEIKESLSFFDAA